MNAARFLLITALFTLTSGCFLKKKPTIPVPAAPIPAAAIPAPVTPAPTPVQPPPVPAPATQPITEPAPTKPSPFPPTTVPAQPRPTPAPATRTPIAPVPTPSLGAILTPDQRKQLDTAYQADLRQANTVLNSLNGKTLTPGQTDSVSRARAFIRQAAQYHDRDLTTAAELARRARVLTQDLAGALK